MPDETPPDARPCPPCRGDRAVISNLGGTPKTVKCPWCEGGGRLLAEHDAQASWRAVAAG